MLISSEMCKTYLRPHAEPSLRKRSYHLGYRVQGLFQMMTFTIHASLDLFISPSLEDSL